jgi:hypothetical protein
MHAPTPSAVSRTIGALRSFLRETWVSRVFLPDWLKAWASRPCRRRHVPAKPRKGAYLWIEGLGDRNSPDDPVAILASGWMGTAGTLLTPGLALLHGWSYGHLAELRVQQDAAPLLQVHYAVASDTGPVKPSPAWTPPAGGEADRRQRAEHGQDPDGIAEVVSNPVTLQPGHRTVILPLFRSLIPSVGVTSSYL